MKDKKWIVTNISEQALENLAKSVKLSKLALRAFLSKGLDTPEKISDFIYVSIDALDDPFKYYNMEKAALRILKAAESGERVSVYGDYDVDGVTSTAVLTSFLTFIGIDCTFYIPDRREEGYGINKAALSALKDQGVGLVITVDNGITAIEEVKYAQEIGLSIIVTDHHECKDEIPEALAVINPKLTENASLHQNLAGVGVVFKLICAVSRLKYGKDGTDDIIARYGDLIALGTIADIMPLTDENRIIVKYGLEILKKSSNVGLKAIIQNAGIDAKKINSTTVGYTIAPRINAAGRMGCAERAAQLLLTNDRAGATSMALELSNENKCRQETENEILAQAIEQIKLNYDADNNEIFVLDDDSWHSGIIGIVASKITDIYDKPTILITYEENGQGKGSGRSIKGFNLFKGLEKCSDLLVKFGGHELAAGLTIERELVPEFRKRINELAHECIAEEGIIRQVEIDSAVEPQELDIDSVEQLSLLQPFGMGNPAPVFCLYDMKISNVASIGNNKHTKFYVENDRVRLSAVYFGVNPEDGGLVEGDIVDLAFTAEINEFNGNKSVQLLIKHLRPAKYILDTQQRYIEMYLRYKSGSLERSEAKEILPVRDDFVGVYRYLSTKKVPVTSEAGVLSRKVSYQSGRKINVAKLLICLDVFSELGLFEAEVSETVTIYCDRMREGKIKLEKSKILASIAAMAQV